jgi:hypothetical protein
MEGLWNEWPCESQDDWAVRVSRSGDDLSPTGYFRTRLYFSLFPIHVGMRQYWRDFESLGKWSHSGPQKRWWQKFFRDSGGTGFWHETCFMRGGI